MTKRDLVTRISKETGLIQQDVMAVIQMTLDCITESMIKSETIELRNFGVFKVVLRKAHVGRNPKNPSTDVPIPARAAVKFKAGKEMRERVLSRTPTIAPL